jgi:hypothetical protein
MDKYWMQNDLDMDMLAYNAMETGYKIGYIEFVGDSKTIAEIQKEGKNLMKALVEPFSKKSIYNWFERNI